LEKRALVGHRTHTNTRDMPFRG